MKPISPRPPRRGTTLLEVLITVVVIAFGLLGLAGMVTRTTTLSVDTAQRARASALLSDMQGRLLSNRTKAADYVTASTLGEAKQDCAGSPIGTPTRDRCEWNNLLLGVADGGAGAKALGFRGCVTRPLAGQPFFVITVAWGSTSAGVPPKDDCASGAFGDDSYRRILRTSVRVPTLS